MMTLNCLGWGLRRYQSDTWIITDNTKSLLEMLEWDVVLIHDKRKPRAQWTVGVVDEINPLRENKVRGVIVRYISI